LQNENRFKELSNYIKHNNIHILGIPEDHILGIPEEEEKEKGAENLFEKIMAENSPDLKKRSISRRHRNYSTKSMQGGPHQDR